MSFYKQPLTYQCGPLALKYALVMLGKMEDERDIEEIAGSTWWQGTDEIGLEKAANYYDCDFEEIAEGADAETSFFNLRSNLKEGFPVVLCVDKWSHWIAVVGFEKDKYVCVDSGMKKVIIILREKELLKRWKYRDKKLDTFSGYAVVPQRPMKSRAKFSLESAKALMTEKYEELAVHWDSYFSVLAELARNKIPASEHTITVREFLRRYQKSIVEYIAEWHGGIEYEDLNILFENFQFVADVYGMVIHLNDEKHAIINFTCVLMMHTTHNYGTYSYL